MQYSYISALLRQPVYRCPVWMMRQAGRYLPEYRKLRANAGGFMQMCKNPQLACEITLQPLKRFDLDAAILFSDILTVPDALGQNVKFIEGKGPVFSYMIDNELSLANLKLNNFEKNISYVAEAVDLIKSKIDPNIPLIGFCGSPFTLASYMVEGKTSKDHMKIRQTIYTRPNFLKKLLDILSYITVFYLKSQIKAGADSIMIFDTWGGILTKQNYLDFSLKYIKNIIQNIKKYYDTPITVFTKGGGMWLDNIADSGCQAVGLDWQTDITDAKDKVGNKLALQGNLDPSVLYADKKIIQNEVHKIMAKAPNEGYIFNLGHGITPDINPDSVSILVEAVHSYSKNI